jgi:fructose-specific component phosphotransferase system IIB-like protein
VWLFVICVVSQGQAFSQMEKLQDLNIEYGDLRDLRGSRVFVHSENLASRRRILREIAKFPRLQVVASKEEADYVLLFGSNLLGGNAVDGDNLFSGDINNDSVDMVALIMINGATPRTRVCWVSTKRRASISTLQLTELYPFSTSPQAQLIKLLIRSFLSSHPRLKSVPLNHPPEAKAARDFIEALKKAQGQIR